MNELFSNETLFAERLAEMLSDALAQTQQQDKDIRLIVNGRELGSVVAKEGRSVLNRTEKEIALRTGVK